MKVEDLRKEFTKETGCGTPNWEGDGYYPPYVEWLEKIIKIVTGKNVHNAHLPRFIGEKALKRKAGK